MLLLLLVVLSLLFNKSILSSSVLTNDNNPSNYAYCGIQKLDQSSNPITSDMNIATTSSLLPVQFKVVTRDSISNTVQFMDWDIANWDIITWHFKWLEKHTNKDKVFHCVDMGGNHGYYSFYLAKHNCTVEIFEVQKDLIEVEKASVLINEFHDKILIHHLGLSDADSNMHINGVGGTAFLTNDSTATSYTVTVSTADKCLYHRSKHIAFVKIDVEGFEVRALTGFNNTIHTLLIEAFLIEVGPGRWHKAGITIEEGVSTILSVLSSHFHCYVIVRNFDSCPTTVYPKVSDDDVLLSGASVIKRVPWNEFLSVMMNMAKGDNDCNFFLLRDTHTLQERLHVVAYNHNMENRIIRGSSGKAFYYYIQGLLRPIPNMDTYDSILKTIKNKEVLVIPNSKLVILKEGTPIQTV